MYVVGTCTLLKYCYYYINSLKDNNYNNNNNNYWIICIIYLYHTCGEGQWHEK